MRQALPALLLLVALLCLAAPQRPAAAAPIRLTIGPASPVRATLVAGATDTYTLDVVAGRTYLIEVFDAAPGADRQSPFIEAEYSPTEPLGTWPTASGNIADSLRVTATRTGTLTVLISGVHGWSGGYSLRALAHRGQPGAAWLSGHEPDDRCELARPISHGAAESAAIAPRATAYLTKGADQDYFVAQAQAGHTYYVIAGGLPASAPLGSIQLHASSPGDANEGNAGSGFYGAPAEVRIEPGAEREICIEVKGAYDWRWTGAYTLRLIDAAQGSRVYLPLLRR